MMLARTPFDSIPYLEHPGAQLALCALCDAIGMFTYVVPVIGELGDIIWAPIQALFILGMLGFNKMGVFMTGFGFAEEIIPLATDWIPSCLMAWFIVNVSRRGRR